MARWNSSAFWSIEVSDKEFLQTQAVDPNTETSKECPFIESVNNGISNDGAIVSGNMSNNVTNISIGNLSINSPEEAKQIMQMLASFAKMEAPASLEKLLKSNVDECRELLRKKDIDNALPKLLELLSNEELKKIDDLYYRVLFNTGTAYLQTSNKEKALTYYHKAEKIKSDDIKLLIQIGTCYLFIDRAIAKRYADSLYTDSSEDQSIYILYSQAHSDIHPDDYLPTYLKTSNEGKFSYGLYFREQGDYIKSAEYFAEIAESDPHELMYQEMAGYAFLNLIPQDAAQRIWHPINDIALDNIERSVKYLDRTYKLIRGRTSLFEFYGTFYNNYIIALILSSQDDKAIEVSSELIEYELSYNSVVLSLSAMRNAGRHEDVIKLLDEHGDIIEELAPSIRLDTILLLDNADMLEEYIKAMRSKGTEKAKEFALAGEMIIANKDGSSLVIDKSQYNKLSTETLTLYADTLFKNDEKEKALDILKYIEDNTDMSISSHLFLGDLYYALNEDEKAEEHLKVIFDLGFNRHAALQYLSLLHKGKKDKLLKEAFQTLKRMIVLDKSFLSMYHVFCYRTGDYTSSVGKLEQFLSKNKDNLWARVELYAHFNRADEKSKATSFINKKYQLKEDFSIENFTQYLEVRIREFKEKYDIDELVKLCLLEPNSIFPYRSYFGLMFSPFSPVGEMGFLKSNPIVEKDKIVSLCPKENENTPKVFYIGRTFIGSSFETLSLRDHKAKRLLEKKAGDVIDNASEFGFFENECKVLKVQSVYQYVLELSTQKMHQSSEVDFSIISGTTDYVVNQLQAQQYSDPLELFKKQYLEQEIPLSLIAKINKRKPYVLLMDFLVHKVMPIHSFSGNTEDLVEFEKLPDLADRDILTDMQTLTAMTYLDQLDWISKGKGDVYISPDTHQEVLFLHGQAENPIYIPNGLDIKKLYDWTSENCKVASAIPEKDYDEPLLVELDDEVRSIMNSISGTDMVLVSIDQVICSIAKENGTPSVDIQFLARSFLEAKYIDIDTTMEVLVRLSRQGFTFISISVSMMLNSYLDYIKNDSLDTLHKIIEIRENSPQSNVDTIANIYNLVAKHLRNDYKSIYFKKMLLCGLLQQPFSFGPIQARLC